jgi:hypothetical protein
VTFVDDDVAEVVLRVVIGEEGGVVVFIADVERLIGGDDDAGVHLGVSGSGYGGIVAEPVEELALALLAQFVAVADEEGAF